MTLAQQLYDRGISSNYTHNTFDPEGNNVIDPFKTENDIVIWKEDIPTNGNQTNNRIRIDPERGIYPFGFAEAHEITHFLLMSYGFTIQTPNDIENNDHNLGGFMTPGTQVVDQYSNTLRSEGVDFKLSPAAAEKIITGVPRVDDKIIQSYTPSLKGRY